MCLFKLLFLCRFHRDVSGIAGPASSLDSNHAARDQQLAAEVNRGIYLMQFAAKFRLALYPESPGSWLIAEGGEIDQEMLITEYQQVRTPTVVLLA